MRKHWLCWLLGHRYVPCTTEAGYAGLVCLRCACVAKLVVPKKG